MSSSSTTYGRPGLDWEEGWAINQIAYADIRTRTSVRLFPGFAVRCDGQEGPLQDQPIEIGLSPNEIFFFVPSLSFKESYLDWQQHHVQQMMMLSSNALSLSSTSWKLLERGHWQSKSASEKSSSTQFSNHLQLDVI